MSKSERSASHCVVISSLIADDRWRQTLSLLAEWTPEPLPALVVVPHPDDETLGVGAFISTLRSLDVPVTIAAVTDGENAYDTSPDERAELRSVREVEQTAALRTLGVAPKNIHRLRLEDSNLLQAKMELTERLLYLAKDGMQIVAPWSGDFHPDHIACAHAARYVAREKHLPLLSYFFWTWHQGTPELVAGLHLRRFAPSPAALQAKTDALVCHRSQLHRPAGEPILPERLLGPARWPFEVFVQE